jgi:hypothetical protein
MTQQQQDANIDDDVIVRVAQPKMQVESWTEQYVNDTLIFFQVIWMKPSVLWVWIGTQAPKFKYLSTAMNTKYDRLPMCSDLLGWDDTSDNVSKHIAQRLALKYKNDNIMVYVSYNGDDNAEARLFAEKSIAGKLKSIVTPSL